MAQTMNNLIFISCGQLTETEKSLGTLLKGLVDKTPGFQAYFAETVHDLTALAQHVFEGVQQCVGAIIILHDRGTVTQLDGIKWGHRSSVWINQEVAILAYRQFFESRKIPILAFIDSDVKLEGAMTSLIINPQPLPSSHQLAGVVNTWLAETEFADTSNEVFLSKWEQLTEPTKMAIAALFQEGGKNVKESSVRQRLTKDFNIDKNTASDQLRTAKGEFTNTDLIKLVRDTNSGDELSVNPTWEFQLKKQCNKWLKTRGS